MARSFAPVAVVGIFLAVIVGLRIQKRVDIPDHLLGHPGEFVPGLLSEKVGDDLMRMFKEMKDYPTSTGDQHKIKHQHIGEAVPVNADGSCSDPFLVPFNKTLCVFPGRADIGRHFVLGGGVQALKESYERMISRVQSFGRYIFNLHEHPVVERLFADKTFLTAAKKICPKDQQVLDPFQFNFIVQIPGQTVALHLDAPYFWGATRFEVPQWLLTSMVGSGLFLDRFVNQVQVVGYFHRWNDTDRDGDFIYWDESTPEFKKVPSQALAGSAVDGSKVVHAANIYMEKVKPPVFSKDEKNVLSYLGDDKWTLFNQDKPLQNYTTDDLRCTIVYRARCFATDADKKKFNALPDNEYLELDYILETMRADMEKKGVWSGPIVPEGQSQNAPEYYRKFGLKIMDTYQPLPLSPHALIPYNYCALPRLVPALKPLFSLFCD